MGEKLLEVRQSNLTKLLRCRRQFVIEEAWNLRPAYGDNEKPAPQPTKADYGTAMHAGIAAYYRGDDVIHAVWESVYDQAAADEFTGNENAGEWPKVFSTALGMTLGYIQQVEREGLDEGREILDVEKELRLPMGKHHGVEVILTGTVDLVFYDWNTDEYGLDDHKSVHQLGQVPHPADFQLRHYGWMLTRLSTDGLVWTQANHNLVRRVNPSNPRSKPPYFDRVPVNLNEQMYEYHTELLDSLIDDYVTTIQQVVDNPHAHVVRAPPNITTECSWRCNHKALCGQMQDGAWVDTILSDYHHNKEVSFE